MIQLNTDLNLPLPPSDADNTFYEFMVSENGQWEHWSERVCTYGIW